MAKLKIAKKSKWAREERENYVESRNDYTKHRKMKKARYYMKLQSAFNNVHYSNEFWKIVKGFKYKLPEQHKISNEEWIQFYDKIQGKRIEISNLYTNVGSRNLESVVNLNEFMFAIKKLSNNKAPGEDGITNEFLKQGPMIFHEQLLQLINYIWETEEVPSEWAGSKTAMLFKKSNQDDPIDYRPISLLNTVLKLITPLIQARLVKWAEESGFTSLSDGI